MTQAPQLSGKPRNAHRLLALWETFGKYIGLPDRDWEELAPVLDRLPPLELANPRIDKPAAEAVLQKYAMRDGVKPCPVRWFPDARSAHACHPALALWARCAFPSTDPPAALSAAWHAGAAAGGPALVDVSSTGAKALAAGGNPGPEITSLAALLEMYAAGLLFYWIGPEEIVCVPRPSLWLGRGWRLHRDDGPAVEWPTGERHFFWNNIEVPQWIIEHPDLITRQHIASESDGAVRRCMMERFGLERFSVMERWAEWQNCRFGADVDMFLGSGLHRTFAAISKRISDYSEGVVQRLAPLGLRQPQLDRAAASAALQAFLREWGEPTGRLRWFEDRRSALKYLQRNRRARPRAAYWPRLRIASTLDAAWYRDNLNPLNRSNNMRWLEMAEDWQDWTSPLRARDCEEDNEINRRVVRLQDRITARASRPPLQAWADLSEIDIARMSLSDPPIRRWTVLMDAFAAGLFYYAPGPQETVCIPRPCLWVANEQLHRADGPAVEWVTGERYFFWRGIEVPDWVVEEPERITMEMIRAQANAELRRCLIDRFGEVRFLRETGAQLIAEDAYGKLWRPAARGSEPTHALLQVVNAMPERDGTQRLYFLRVPPHMRTPHEAVAWTYGLSPEQYEIAVRT
jgi:hypothetical protein